MSEYDPGHGGDYGADATPPGADTIIADVSRYTAS
jgi:hypothetical protein